MRAAEKKLGERKETRGRKKVVTSNKPSKEALEKDLKAGLTIAQLGEKHTVCSATISNWIKAYGLVGVKGTKKPDDATVDKPVVITEQSIIETEPGGPKILVKGLEMEFKTYGPPVITPPTPAEIEHFFADTEVPELPKAELPELRISMDVVDEPVPGKSIDGYWKDLRTVLFKLEGEYVDNAVIDARKSFRERLREMLADVVGELGITKEVKHIG